MAEVILKKNCHEPQSHHIICRLPTKIHTGLPIRLLFAFAVPAVTYLLIPCTFRINVSIAGSPEAP